LSLTPFRDTFSEQEPLASITLRAFKPKPDAKLHVLGVDGELAWKQGDDDVQVSLPQAGRKQLVGALTWTLRISAGAGLRGGFERGSIALPSRSPLCVMALGFDPASEHSRAGGRCGVTCSPRVLLSKVHQPDEDGHAHQSIHP